MCGFLGRVAPGQVFTEHKSFVDALQLLKHRGPDDEGYLLANCQTGNVVSCRGADTSNDLRLPTLETHKDRYHDAMLGFRRLAIIDLSMAGHQPMPSADHKSWLVFNGEIYNYIELRDELIKQGCHFRSGTDSEVILHAYEQWGTACLHRLVGMWAFAILDLKRFKLFLARDPFGIKPLYYSQAGRGISFASEIQALLALPGMPRRINPQCLNDYLRHGLTDHSSGTMIADVSQFPPAHYTDIDLRAECLTISPTPYWSPVVKKVAKLSFADAAANLRDLFLDSVRLHLRSDVPIGLALSGGVDSCSILAAMRDVDPTLDPQTFSYISDDSTLGEERWIDCMIKTFRASSYKTTCRAEDLDLALDALIRNQGEPFCSSSILASARVFRMARENGVKVMLTGQGADEIFGGYAVHRGARLASLVRQFRYFQAATFLRGAQLQSRRSEFFSTLLIGGSTVLPASLHSIARRLTSNDLVSNCLNAGWFKRRAVIPEWRTHSRSTDVLRDTLIGSITTTLPMLLRYEDRNSMTYSIESRVPFLTTELATFALSLPEQYLIAPDGTSKAIFRAAMRGIVPDAILDRRDKISFDTPEFQWLSALQPKVDKILTSEFARSIPAINTGRILNDWHLVLAGKARFTSRFWRYLNLIEWSRIFDVRHDC